MSTLNVSNITDGTDTVETGYVLNGSAKVWVNFNGTGTIAIRESLNVSSLTDIGTGRYYTNFTNAMNTSDFGGSAAGRTAGDVGFNSDGENTTTRFRNNTYNSSLSHTDANTIVSLALGDLA